MRNAGTYEVVSTAGEPFNAFVPAPLPPVPPLDFTGEDTDLLQQAAESIARLESATALLPDVGLFLYTYVRKEAVVSSQIEGTQSSLADLLLYESDHAPGVPMEDAREVSDYVAALSHGMARLRGGFPLSQRLLREVHGVLLRSGRGSTKSPGEFRRSQVWIGGSRPGNASFVPPPAHRVVECMSALEKFLHGVPVETPTLVKAGLAHVQFETIHPFLDGNGRIGRMLVTLLLTSEGALTEPVLYLSLYFKTQRQEYYDRLQRVRTQGDWEGWLRFFLRGVVDTAGEAVAATRRILALFEKDRHAIEGLGRSASSTFRVFGYLQRRPIAGIRQVAKELSLTHPTVSSALDRLEKLRIVTELTGHKRNRVFAYAPYVAILSEGTEPLG